MLRYLVVLFVLSLAVPVQASKKFAAPTGSAGNTGISPDQAWTLAFALGNSSPLVPGDTLVLTDGIFEGNFTSTISGTSEKPIVILAQNEGKAIIDVGKQRTSGTGLIINGSYTWFVGIHVTSSSLIKKSDASNGFAPIPYESGISVFGDNNKIINCWIYDVVGGGLELWRSGRNLEVYGSVIFNNGSQDVSRGTGHGMYIQHDQPAQPKVIENNFVFQNASQGINIYTTNPENSGVVAKRNVSFNTGVIATFDPLVFRPPHNLSIGSQNNVSSEMEVISNLFYTDLQGGRLSTNEVSNVTIGRTYTPNHDISFNDNIVFGGRNQVEFQPLEGLSFQRNRLLNSHGSFFAFLGNSSSFPNSFWDSNVYSNLANTAKPFQGLNFQEWKSEYFPFDKVSTYSTAPANSKEVLITQNKYDPSRFHVSILSFTDAERVELNFSDFEEFKNFDFEIRDVQNPFDPNQKVSGIFNGSSISFPMNWTKSLKPKGNMPFQPVHTDLTFGTFLLVFERGENSPAVFPDVKDSVALYLNSEGKAFLAPNDFLVNQPAEPFTYVSSGGFEFSCSNIGSTPITITSKNTRTGEERIDQTGVWVFDTIPPFFDAANATLLFDPVAGKVSVNLPDFSPTDFFDNCNPYWNIEQSRYEVTCAEIYQNPEAPTWEFPVELTLKDPSGNSFTRSVKVIIGNVIESKKVSITSLDPLNDNGTSTLRLGNELEYQVLSWRKNGDVIPGQTGKEITVNSSGTYYASLLLATGCPVEARSLLFEIPTIPSEYKNDVTLVLNESGKAALTQENIFGESEGIDDEVILSQTEFDCTDLGTQKVKVAIIFEKENHNHSNSTEFWINVNVVDGQKPILITKTPSLQFDKVTGVLELKPEDFVSSLSDNCGIKSLQLNKTTITCGDYDLPVDIILEATDFSGNSTSKLVTIFVSPFESKKISISPELGTQFLVGQEAEIRLGEEFEYFVEGWYRNGQLLIGQKGRALLTDEPGTYWALLLPTGGGCTVESKKTEITFSEVPFGQIKEKVELVLSPEGKAELSPQQVFVNWPQPDPTLTITLNKSSFSCENLGENEVIITIKKASGETWVRKIKVIVKDQTKPVLVPKNINLELDVTKGVVEISPESVLAEFGDNCGLKSLTINKNRFTCEDLGKEFQIAIRAEDNSGNVTETVAVVSVVRSEPEKVIVSGKKEICSGEKSILELSSSKAFEVVRWRRNGTEIQGQTGKTLEVKESGKYHAVIRYPGACLSETAEFEVKVNPTPTGEITVDGDILRAPEGNFTYQWFRNGEPIAGATSRTFTAQLMGEYSVELANDAGCKSRLKPVTLTISGIGGKPVNKAIDLKIYPNPASDHAILELPDGVLASKPEISVYSSEGKEVSSAVQFTVLSDFEIEISLNRLAKGTYLIWIVGENQKTYFGKLVVVN
ncbi:T9SS type A sorting domain-containing protein [Algoriphagus sp. A40]|uniref:T9SS type A sorting domain-containing protein n=1 Tax=Algoriphagus sp. A40 TaxID=1945863 RepID=UPI0009848A4A|nr:T9SS type A sorting domain-containing protein [Algoriphagus sp. A40]OOG74853.1 hypothetical protein B0E43_10740 [Algoriphagus sp. A40]